MTFLVTHNPPLDEYIAAAGIAGFRVIQIATRRASAHRFLRWLTSGETSRLNGFYKTKTPTLDLMRSPFRLQGRFTAAVFVFLARTAAASIVASEFSLNLICLAPPSTEFCRSPSALNAGRLLNQWKALQCRDISSAASRSASR
jgi:hypothetical protein